MIAVKVSSARVKAAQPFAFMPYEEIGDCAQRVASSQAQGLGSYSFAWEGRVLDAKAKIGNTIPDNSRVELVIR